MRLLIERFSYTRYGVLGQLTLEADEGVPVNGYTIELPWRGNRRGKSCILPGAYPRVQRHESPTFGPCLWVRGVRDRTEILVHTANSPSDLDGCIGPGAEYGWAADYWDGVERPLREEHAVWSSQDTLDRILSEIDRRGVEELSLDVRHWQPERP